jgi:hypothetical protein
MKLKIAFLIIFLLLFVLTFLHIRNHELLSKRESVISSNVTSSENLPETKVKIPKKCPEGSTVILSNGGFGVDGKDISDIVCSSDKINKYSYFSNYKATDTERYENLNENYVFDSSKYYPPDKDDDFRDYIDSSNQEAHLFRLRIKDKGNEEIGNMCCSELLVTKAGKLIFRYVSNFDGKIVPNSASNDGGFIIETTTEDQYPYGYCCPTGYKRIYINNVNGKFAPISEQTVTYLQLFDDYFK